MVKIKKTAKVVKKTVEKVVKKTVEKVKAIKINELPEGIVFKHHATTKEEADRLLTKRRRNS